MDTGDIIYRAWATYKGQPLTEDMAFLVVTNNYRASGGGYFPHLDGSRTILQSTEENRKVILDYILAKGTIDIKADNNWSLAPVETAGKVLFAATPRAKEYLMREEFTDIVYERDEGDRSIFAYDFAAAKVKAQNSAILQLTDLMLADSALVQVQ